MPDQPQPPEGSWLNDKILSVSHGAETPFRYDGTGFRLGENDPYLRIHFTSVYVRDQERSRRFYVDRLGFILLTDARFASGNRWIEVAPPDGTATLALVRPLPGSDEEHLIGRSGMVTFLTEDVEAKYREWSARGVNFTIPPHTPDWGGTFCRFEDPDGNAFTLAGFDRMTRELEARRSAYANRLEAERRAIRELEIAKQVQARLFPQRLPTVSGLDYAGVCLQALSVGGDYYDFLDLGSGHLAMVVGDIAGKGIAAALLMANLQAGLRSQCVSAVNCLEQFLGSVNGLLFQNTSSNSYATLFFSDYDHHTGRLRYANCGHLPSLILRGDGGVDRLEATCTVVGLFEDWDCRVGESVLRPGDAIVFYTDGVTESFNSDAEEFGEERLIASLRRHAALPASRFAAALVADVLAFSGTTQFDDITLIVAVRDSPAE